MIKDALDMVRKPFPRRSSMEELPSVRGDIFSEKCHFLLCNEIVFIFWIMPKYIIRYIKFLVMWLPLEYLLVKIFSITFFSDYKNNTYYRSFGKRKKITITPNHIF